MVLCLHVYCICLYKNIRITIRIKSFIRNRNRLLNPNFVNELVKRSRNLFCKLESEALNRTLLLQCTDYFLFLLSKSLFWFSITCTYFGDASQKLYNLFSPSPFLLQCFRKSVVLQRSIIDSPSNYTNWFASLFIMRTAKNGFPFCIVSLKLQLLSIHGQSELGIYMIDAKHRRPHRCLPYLRLINDKREETRDFGQHLAK